MTFCEPTYTILHEAAQLLVHLQERICIIDNNELQAKQSNYITERLNKQIDYYDKEAQIDTPHG